MALLGTHFSLHVSFAPCSLLGVKGVYNLRKSVGSEEGGEKFLKNLNVFFMTKNLYLVYPPLGWGPFSENP